MLTNDGKCERSEKWQKKHWELNYERSVLIEAGGVSAQCIQQFTDMNHTPSHVQFTIPPT
jgi:hypothetical protein